MTSGNNAFNPKKVMSQQLLNQFLIKMIRNILKKIDATLLHLSYLIFLSLWIFRNPYLTPSR